jgi:branched-chain amino acid transport system ATP-binding protein
MTVLLRTGEITARFGGLLALNGVSLSVQNGHVHGIIGPNGAGKTTFLNVLSGHIRPAGGSIVFEGRDLTSAPAHKRAALGIRRTFQNLRLFREMTALENVMVGLHAGTSSEIISSLLRTRSQRAEEREIKERSLAALDFAGLLSASDAIAESLPYGHQRLLEIARAFVARPKLLLLDEPAAGLNSAEARMMVGLIRRIQAAGITVILVEHHMEVVMRACDHITVLNYGKMLADGDPAYIRAHPGVVEAYLGTKRRAGRHQQREAAKAHHAAS